MKQGATRANRRRTGGVLDRFERHQQPAAEINDPESAGPRYAISLSLFSELAMGNTKMPPGKAEVKRRGRGD